MIRIEQLSFFKEAGQSAGLPTEVLEYLPNIFDEQLGLQLMERFIAETPWTQKVVSMYDKQVLMVIISLRHLVKIDNIISPGLSFSRAITYFFSVS